MAWTAVEPWEEAGGKLGRLDLALAAALALAAGLARLPFRSTMLYAYDSGNFALALSRFDLAASQPQPPGYVLYVGSARALLPLLGEPNLAYVTLSILAGSLAVGLTALLGTAMYGRGVGLGAALLLAGAPGTWMYSAITYPYTCLMLGSVATAAGCWPVWQGRARVAPLAALVLGLASGFRQDLLPFLLPLLLAALWRARPARATLLASALALVAGMLIWLLPLLWLAGGPFAYLIQVLNQARWAANVSSPIVRGADGLGDGLALFGDYLQLDAGWTGLPLLVAAAALVHDRRRAFLAWWLLPASLFYLLVHLGDPGYLLSLLPGLMLLASTALALLAGAAVRATRLSPSAAGLLAPALVLVAAGLLAYAGSASFVRGRGATSLNAIRELEARLSAQIAWVRATASPEATLVVADWRTYRQLVYYLPEYRVLFSQDGRLDDPGAVRAAARIVSFSQLETEQQRLHQVRRLRLLDQPLVSVWEYEPAS